MSDEMKRELNGLRTEMQKGLGGMRHEMGALRDELRKGLSETRQEMGELRGELRKGLSESRHDMGEIRSMFRRTMIHVANMTGDIAGIHHELANNVATKDDVSMLYNHIDEFAGSRKDADFNEAKNVHRLDEHAERLRKLEDRRI